MSQTLKLILENMKSEIERVKLETEKVKLENDKLKNEIDTLKADKINVSNLKEAYTAFVNSYNSNESTRSQVLSGLQDRIVEIEKQLLF